MLDNIKIKRAVAKRKLGNSPYSQYGGKIVPREKGDCKMPGLLKKHKSQGRNILTPEPHLTVFCELHALEHGEKTRIE